MEQFVNSWNLIWPKRLDFAVDNYTFENKRVSSFKSDDSISTADVNVILDCLYLNRKIINSVEVQAQPKSSIPDMSSLRTLWKIIVMALETACLSGMEPGTQTQMDPIISQYNC